MRLPILIISFLFISLIHSGQSSFIENRGQVMDQNGLPNTQALFVLPLRGMNVVLSPNGFSYDVFEVLAFKNPTATIAEQLKMGLEITPTCPEKIQVHRVDISFENMNKNVQIEKCKTSDNATYNYYTTGTPNEGIHGVKKFNKIIYHNIYDGIDVEFVTTQQKEFEYNFIIHAGADLNKLALHYTGALGLQLSQNKLHIDLATNKVEESIPLSFIQGCNKPINVQYALNQNTLQFITPYDIFNETVIIDPTPNLIHATYFGGVNEEMILDSKIDSGGNLYMTGHTTSINNIATIGAFQTEIGGTYDVLLAKFNSDYQIEWSTYLGGSGWDYGTSVSLTNDAIFIAGLTLSTAGMSSIGAFQEDLIGFQNGFASRFDLSGARVWSSYFGTNVESFIGAAIIDGNSLVAVGSTQSATLPFSNNPYQANLNGLKDCLISQWDLNGLPFYCSYFGGEASEVFSDVEQNITGEILMLGGTSSETGISTNDAYQTQYGGGLGDLMLVAFSSNFQLEYATYFGSAGDDYNSSLEYSNGKIIICGQTNYGELLTTSNAFQTTNYGGSDAFYAIFNEQLDLEYCTLFGGELGDSQLKLLGNNNELYFIGASRSTENIATSGSYQESYMDSGVDNVWKIFIGKMDADNNPIWCTYFGNYSYTIPANLHINNGALIVTGWTRSTADLPEEMQISIATPNAYQTENAGAEDAFIAVFDSFTGVELLPFDNSIYIYPNPATEQVSLYITNYIASPEAPTAYSIYDAEGKLCGSGSISSYQTTINTSQLSTGLYQVSVETKGKQTATLKLMK